MGNRFFPYILLFSARGCCDLELFDNIRNIEIADLFAAGNTRDPCLGYY